MAYKKSVQEKLQTKLDVLRKDNRIEINKNKYKINGVTFLEVKKDCLKYGTKRFYPNLTEPIKEDNFTVSIILNHENLKFLNSNLINPPKGAKKVNDVFKQIPNIQITRIIIGSDVNSVNNQEIKITRELYEYLLKVNSEEGKEKEVRIFNRMAPFLKNEFSIDTNGLEVDKNYSLLLKEILASGQFNQEDLIELTSKLEIGNSSTTVIKRQVNKQVEWLISEIEAILDIDKVTIPLAKQIGNKKFGYTKNSINGPEHLMEKILTDYGQHSLFGVPALLNTNKYVIHEGTSRSQFDLILINHLGDVELVELKRPDQYLFEYGDGRGKFYPSKQLSIAISQLERYITTINKDNDPEYLINKKTIREFINEKISNDIHFESIRPKGLIIMGSWSKLSKSYDNLTQEQKRRLSKKEYNNDSLQAYKEIKNSLKNITIMTYSEMLEAVRVRINYKETN